VRERATQLHINTRVSKCDGNNDELHGEARRRERGRRGRAETLVNEDQHGDREGNAYLAI